MLQLRLYTRLSILHEEIAGQLKKILLAQRVKVLGVVTLLHGKKNTRIADERNRSVVIF